MPRPGGCGPGDAARRARRSAPMSRRAPGRRSPGRSRAARARAATRIASIPCVGSSERTSTAAPTPGRPADDVDAPVDPVGAVHVEPPRRAEHRGVPGGHAPERVRRGVVGRVRLGLDDRAADAVDEERPADERAGGRDRVALEVERQPAGCQRYPSPAGSIVPHPSMCDAAHATPVPGQRRRASGAASRGRSRGRCRTRGPTRDARRGSCGGSRRRGTRAATRSPPISTHAWPPRWPGASTIRTPGRDLGAVVGLVQPAPRSASRTCRALRSAGSARAHSAAVARHDDPPCRDVRQRRRSGRSRGASGRRCRCR